MTAWRGFVERLPLHARPARIDPIRLVCFDLDGVLLDAGSSWVTVHKHFGVSNEASLHEFLNGAISEEEFIRRDVALWRRQRPGVQISDVERIFQGAPLVPGARETVEALRRGGIDSAIVSGGIESAVRQTAHRLGIRRFFGNALEADAQGRLTGGGIVHTPLRDKGAPVRALAARLGIPLGSVASVGNSSPDIAMFRTTGVAIAFRPTDEFTGREADAIVAGPDLRQVLSHLRTADGRRRRGA